jgi:hypothetical protein
MTYMTGTTAESKRFFWMSLTSLLLRVKQPSRSVTHAQQAFSVPFCNNFNGTAISADSNEISGQVSYY